MINAVLIFGAIIVIAMVVAVYILVVKHDEGRWV